MFLASAVTVKIKLSSSYTVNALLLKICLVLQQWQIKSSRSTDKGWREGAGGGGGSKGRCALWAPLDLPLSSFHLISI